MTSYLLRRPKQIPSLHRVQLVRHVQTQASEVVQHFLKMEQNQTKESQRCESRVYRR
jgi:hypothetical protein